jgi:hypothetical protein
LAGRLYGRLGEFARGPACAAAYQAAFKQAFKNQAREPASWQRTGFDEWFMFEGGSAQGRTIGLFAMMHRDLAEEELALLGAWLRTPRRQYRVAAVGTGTVDLVEVAGRERRTVREAYRLPLPYLEVGDVIDARVLPAGGESSFLSEACFFVDRK